MLSGTTGPGRAIPLEPYIRHPRWTAECCWRGPLSTAGGSTTGPRGKEPGSLASEQARNVLSQREKDQESGQACCSENMAPQSRSPAPLLSDAASPPRWPWSPHRLYQASTWQPPQMPAQPEWHLLQGGNGPKGQGRGTGGREEEAGLTREALGKAGSRAGGEWAAERGAWEQSPPVPRRREESLRPERKAKPRWQQSPCVPGTPPCLAQSLTVPFST